MKVVRFNKSGGAVSIKITVTGLVAWKYVYYADECATHEWLSPNISFDA